MRKNDTEVRRFAKGDIDHIVTIAMQEVPKLKHYETIKIEETRIRFLLENNMNDEGAFCAFVLVDLEGNIIGCIAAYCVTQLISWDKSTGDIFLFVDPKWRSMINAVKLISAYVNWAKRRNAKLIQATHTSGYGGEAFDTLLRKHCGFEVVGTLYRIHNV